MDEKIYCYEDPFNDGQSDAFFINISDAKNNNDFYNQNSKICENKILATKQQDFIKFQVDSEIQVKKILKENQQVNAFQRTRQQENNLKITPIETKGDQLNQNLSMLSPFSSNVQESSSLSLSLQEKTRKPSLTKPSVKKQVSSTLKNLNTKVNENKIQRERKLQTEKHVRITSEKFIQYFSQEGIQQTEEFEQRNPESIQSEQNVFTQLSKQFEYIGDFSLIRKQMVELALGKKLNVMQNTNEFVTVKQPFNKDYCQCLIKACLNMDQQSGGVYQLKNCIYKRSKAKFILVSGSQKKFFSFFRSLLIRLWQLNKLRLRNDCIVEFLVSAQKQKPQMKQIKKSYTKLYNQLNGVGSQNKHGLLTSKLIPKSIVSTIKDNFKRLRSPQKHNKQNKSITRNLLQRLTQLNQKVNQQYYHLIIKLKTKNQLSYDSNFQKQLQKQIYFHQFPMWKLWGLYNNSIYEIFLKKQQFILSKYSIKQIFQYLEIQDQYSLFFTSPKKNEKIPFKQCISIVQNMASNIMMPEKFCQLLSQFYQHLKSQYSQLYANKPFLKLSSMDEQLPVTIFVLLMSQFDKQKTTTLNFLGKLDWIQRWINQYQKQMSSDHFQASQQQRMSKIKKIIINFQTAFSFIINDWQINQ